MIEGTGAMTPSNYTVLINGNATLRNVVRRTDGHALPGVAMTGSIVGTRSVVVNSPSDSVGSWATLKNLTMNGNAGRREMPAGRYGTVSMNANCTLAIGTPGATQLYQFEALNLNGTCKLEVLGPVVVRVKNAITINAKNIIGNIAHPEWLTIESATGGLTVNGQGKLYGSVLTPSGPVIVNGQGELIGGVRCEKLIVNGGGLLRLAAVNTAPSVNAGLDQEVRLPLSARLNGTVSDDGRPAPVTVTWSKVSGPGTVTFAAANSASTTASFGVEGTYVLRLTATDTEFTVTDEMSVTVLPANLPPTVTLTAPAEGSLFETEQTVSLSATAADDYGVARVEFYARRSGEEPVKITEDLTSPYAGQWVPTVAGIYHLEARATDTDALVVSSELVNVTVEPSNDAPIAEGQQVAAFEDQPKPIVLVYSDSDGDALTVTFDGPLHGTISGTAPNITYTPNANYHGVDSFTYTVTDPEGLGASATVSIVVDSVNDVPVVQLAEGSTDEDTAVQIAITATDADGDTLTLSGSSSTGTVSISGNTLTSPPTQISTAKRPSK